MYHKTRERVAVGASAAAGGGPCLEVRLVKCGEVGPTRGSIQEAVEVAVMVNRGAAPNTRLSSAERVGTAASASVG